MRRGKKHEHFFQTFCWVWKKDGIQSCWEDADGRTGWVIMISVQLKHIIIRIEELILRSRGLWIISLNSGEPVTLEFKKCDYSSDYFWIV